jgi:Fur family ferric uptake transcriptional regulator
VILEAIQGVTSHPSADQVYEMVRCKMPRISLGTVYRNLEMLTQQGLIQKLDGQQHKHYDGNTCNHPHFLCQECGLVFDLPVDLATQVELVKEAAKEFEILGQKMEFYGFCPKCRKKQSEDGSR